MRGYFVVKKVFGTIFGRRMKIVPKT